MIGGHYTSYGKLTGTDTWYEHDDARRFKPDRRNVLNDAELAKARDEGYIYVYFDVGDSGTARSGPRSCAL
jgi:hypothetical protein